MGFTKGFETSRDVYSQNTTTQGSGGSSAQLRPSSGHFDYMFSYATASGLKDGVNLNHVKKD
jgi:hypothetical protein